MAKICAEVWSFIQTMFYIFIASLLALVHLSANGLQLYSLFCITMPLPPPPGSKSKKKKKRNKSALAHTQKGGREGSFELCCVLESWALTILFVFLILKLVARLDQYNLSL